jgi:hypothetical protein
MPNDANVLPSRPKTTLARTCSLALNSARGFGSALRRLLALFVRPATGGRASEPRAAAPATSAALAGCRQPCKPLPFSLLSEEQEAIRACDPSRSG